MKHSTFLKQISLEFQIQAEIIKNILFFQYSLVYTSIKVTNLSITI